jgi:hypothetical protein
MKHGKAISHDLLMIETHQLSIPFHVALEDDGNEFQVVNGILPSFLV